MPEDDLGAGADRIFDPQGHGPRIWFQVVPETKAVKNRRHLDIHASGGRTVPIQTRRQRVDAEASRLAGLGAAIAGISYQEGPGAEPGNGAVPPYHVGSAPLDARELRQPLLVSGVPVGRRVEDAALAAVSTGQDVNRTEAPSPACLDAAMSAHRRPSGPSAGTP